MSLWSLILEGMKMRGRSISFLPLFVVGLFVGIVIVYFGKSTIVNNGGLLDEETYVWIRDCRIDKGAFFAYLLFRRFRLVFILILLSTTYLGMIVCVIFPFVFGVSYGLLLGTAVFRYGFQGVLLCLTGCFPQLLLYLPALAFLLRHCGNLCRKIYYQKEIPFPHGNDCFSDSYPSGLSYDFNRMRAGRICIGQFTAKLINSLFVIGKV